jgi:hypothetical protein
MAHQGHGAQALHALANQCVGCRAVTCTQARGWVCGLCMCAQLAAGSNPRAGGCGQERVCGKVRQAIARRGSCQEVSPAAHPGVGGGAMQEQVAGNSACLVARCDADGAGLFFLAGWWDRKGAAAGRRAGRALGRGAAALGSMAGRNGSRVWVGCGVRGMARLYSGGGEPGACAAAMSWRCSCCARPPCVPAQWSLSRWRVSVLTGCSHAHMRLAVYLLLTLQASRPGWGAHCLQGSAAAMPPLGWGTTGGGTASCTFLLFGCAGQMLAHMRPCSRAMYVCMSRPC